MSTFARSLRPRRLAILSSQQVLPNLESVLLALATGRLDSVHLYATQSRDHSQHPASRLRRLLACPDVQTALALPGSPPEIQDPSIGDATPQGVSTWIDGEMTRCPDSDWIVNLTGGTKPMGFGLVDALRQPGVEGWYFGGPGADSRSVHRLQVQDGRVTMEAGAIDGAFERIDTLIGRIPLTRLIEALIPRGTEQDRQVFSSPLPDIDMLPATRELIGQRWKWKRVLARYVPKESVPHLQNPGLGHYFELWMGNLLRAMGLDVAWSVRARASDADQWESDLVVWSGRRICLLDLKLPAANSQLNHSPSNQMREARTTARLMGGSDARAILIRPNWAHDAVLDAMAKDFQVQLIDSANIANLIPRLCHRDLLDHRPPASTEFATLSSLLEEAASKRYTFMRTPFIPATQNRAGEVSIIARLREDLYANDRNWMLVRLPRQSLFLARPLIGDERVDDDTRPTNWAMDFFNSRGFNRYLCQLDSREFAIAITHPRDREALLGAIRTHDDNIDFEAWATLLQRAGVRRYGPVKTAAMRSEPGARP